MARDNSPKERQQKQLERKQGRRASHDRILIVSEGSKTEPNYFREIRAAYRLHTANVEVRPSGLGTAPIQVVRHAQALFEDGDRPSGRKWSLTFHDATPTLSAILHAMACKLAISSTKCKP